MNWDLNRRSLELVQGLDLATLRIQESLVPEGGRLFDFSRGGLAAGLTLARLCVAGLAQIELVPDSPAVPGFNQLWVSTDHPVPACLFSQYAGWQISHETFFAMGSGPMRAAYGREKIFTEWGYQESPEFAVGLLECRKAPPARCYQFLSEKLGIPSDKILLGYAPTASLAGTIQVVARVVETALHKLHELGFDLHQLESATGTAPLPSVAKDDLSAIGRTNDAILYAGQVHLWVRMSDEAIQEIGPKVPSSASPAAGRPFLEIFKEAGDFYKIDPQLFSPAEVTFHNLSSGKITTFGAIQPEVADRSFRS